MTGYKPKHFTVVERDGTISFAKRETKGKYKLPAFSNTAKGGSIPKAVPVKDETRECLPLKNWEHAMIEENISAFNDYFGKTGFLGGKRNVMACRLFLLKLTKSIHKLSDKHLKYIYNRARDFV